MIIKSRELRSDSLEHLMRIEAALADGFRRIEEKLATGQDVFHFFNQGLRAYKENMLTCSERAVRNQVLEKSRADKNLGFPHRKIIDCLLGQYDFTRNAFTEIHLSRLVKEARLGKNMVGRYISFLEEKEYIRTRDDGYRKFIKLRE